MTMTAIEDAERLVPWAEPNACAMQDERVEDAVLRALASPVPADLAHDLPLLRFASGADPIPLVDALMDPPLPRRGGFICDVTNTRATEPNTLWVPAGRSVVQLTVRNSVRGLLADLTSGQLVWS